ncbi:DEAD/DEAH box helicase family protein [Arthrobacter sp. YD2]|uniref:DEAD/DEAH box helicase n=1 Tax=Arthrobacter sp. YD2 TaxID=3058046 RepID=UPI0025B2A264|nr:DEAD/DEAH box helicase family protein [Arthrobacter sp. YD2]MDN3905546.1 DEAD/DEAH box helicase family protein [Arthrobacter sp. YD2]
MKFTLADYQADVVDETLNEINIAVQRLRSNCDRKTAIGLSAPTGAGKTVIASAVLEGLFFGTQDSDPRPDTTVLWLTDDGELNEQSRKKIRASSDRINMNMLRTVEADFDQAEFSPGQVYFLNVQKLGTGATRHIQTGDGRRYSLWETIGNTIRHRGSSFIVLVDEAHRGATDRSRPTILRRILDGATIEVPGINETLRTIVNPPAPLVIGLSATPKKFEAAMRGASGRSLVQVVADVQKVRASGLIKERINVSYAADDQPSDDTLIRQAVADLDRSERQWQKWARTTGASSNPVPLLAIQVPDMTTDAKIGEIVQTLTDASDAFDNADSIAHSFGEHAPVTTTTRLSGVEMPRVIQYIAPTSIAQSGNLRAVIFKQALTTGWDCPRAEVMVSLRSAQEHTQIAQLIGRMVRNPLAKKIEEPEFDDLNAVDLYLPHFNKIEVATVVKSFMDSADIEVPVQLNPKRMIRNPEVPSAVWGVIGGLTREEKPVRRFKSNVNRLVRLGALLDNSDFEHPGGSSYTQESRDVVVEALTSVYNQNRVAIDRVADSLLEVSFEMATFDQHTGANTGTVARTAATSQKNLRQLLEEARRRLPDASAAWYSTSLVIADTLDWDEVVVRTVALARSADAREALEAQCGSRVESWRRSTAGSVARLNPTQRQEFETVFAPIGSALSSNLGMPAAISQKTEILNKQTGLIEELPLYAGHLYALSETKLFPDSFTGWEASVLEAEQSSGTLLGWYRNPVGGSHALSVHYLDSEVSKNLYPDFLFFHDDGANGVAIDLVDPHNHSLADTAPKWAALARYVRKHDGDFRRAAIVIKDAGGVLLAIQLSGQTDDSLERKLAEATSKESIEQLFREVGGAY